MKTYFSAAKLAGAGLTLALPAKTNFQRILTWLSVTHDKASSTLSLWKSTISRATLGGAAAQKVMLCTLTAGIVLNDIVIIQDVVDPTKYEINTMGAVAANVSYTLVNNLANTYASGAKVYGMKVTGGTTAADWIIPVGVATVDKTNATAVFVAEKDQAVLVEASAVTATCDFQVSGILRG
jgi:hypothetical protein